MRGHTNNRVLGSYIRNMIKSSKSNIEQYPFPEVRSCENGRISALEELAAMLGVKLDDKEPQVR